MMASVFIIFNIYKYLSFEREGSGIKHFNKARAKTETCQVPHVMSAEDETRKQMLTERHRSRWNCAC